MARNDFNGDGRSDILWQNVDGRIGVWFATARGGFAYGWTAPGVPRSDVFGIGDFNGDGRADVLWHNYLYHLYDGARTDLDVWLAEPRGTVAPNRSVSLATPPLDMYVAAVGDFNGDHRDDLLWLTDGWIDLPQIWFGTAAGGFDVTRYSNDFGKWYAGTGDFDGDGRTDVLWRRYTGEVSVFRADRDGEFLPTNAALNPQVPVRSGWDIEGTGDFNGDGRSDILWRNERGLVGTWLGTPEAGFVVNDARLAFAPLDWEIVGVGDYDGDGREDILWRNVVTGQVGDWLGQRDGSFIVNQGSISDAPRDWAVQPWLADSAGAWDY